MSLTEINIATSCGESIRALSRKNRVHVMRTFLLETYLHNNNRGCHYLNRGDIVLDVAGGKGDLSWLLKNIDGLDSIVVDPRVMSTHSHILRYATLPFFVPQVIYHVLFHIVALAAHFDRSIEFLGSNPDEAQRRAIPGLTTYQPLAALLCSWSHENIGQPRIGRSSPSIWSNT
jgi:hypothetical protein